MNSVVYLIWYVDETNEMITLPDSTSGQQGLNPRARYPPGIYQPAIDAYAWSPPLKANFTIIAGSFPTWRWFRIAPDKVRFRSIPFVGLLLMHMYD